MARARNIKPGFFLNEELAEIEPLGRILFQGLWCVADRRGRLQDRPKRIKAEVLPYDDCDVDGLLDRLSDRGFLIRYDSGSTRYIQITNFEKHQHPHKNEGDSTIPPPDEYSTEPESDGTSTVNAPESDGTNPPCNLILDTDSLRATEVAAAHVRETPPKESPPEEIELSPAERYVVTCIQAVRGMAAVPDADIVLHLREVLSNRGSPPTEEALRQDALKFRDYWNEKRKTQPDNRKWTGWKRSMTEWFKRTREIDIEPRATRNGVTNGSPAYDPTAIWLEWAEEESDEQDDVWQRNGAVIDVATSEKR